MMVKKNSGVLNHINKEREETESISTTNESEEAEDSSTANGNEEAGSIPTTNGNEEKGVSPMEQESDENSSDKNSSEKQSQICAIFSVFRNLFDLTQGDLAEIMGVSSRQVIGNIESGRSKITYEILYRFISVIDYILSNESKFKLNFMQVESIKLMKMQLSVYLENSKQIDENKVDYLLRA